MAIDHDRLFKELIQTFFSEFMMLFFKEAYDAIDFEIVTFLSEEVFTDVVAGERRRVDLLIETRLNGEAVMIIVHIEVQAYNQARMAERMFIYDSRLYEKYRKRILPIVDNPIAAALLSKMGYNNEERVQVKKEFLRMLVRLELDPARMHLISGFFDTYLELNDIEEARLQEEIQLLEPKEEEKIMELKTNWEKTAEQKGITQGRIEGKLEGKLEGERRILSKFLKAQFGDVSTGMLEQIACLNDQDLLDQLTDQLFHASNLDEASKRIEETYKTQLKMK